MVTHGRTPTVRLRNDNAAGQRAIIADCRFRVANNPFGMPNKQSFPEHVNRNLRAETTLILLQEKQVPNVRKLVIQILRIILIPQNAKLSISGDIIGTKI